MPTSKTSHYILKISVIAKILIFKWNFPPKRTFSQKYPWKQNFSKNKWFYQIFLKIFVFVKTFCENFCFIKHFRWKPKFLANTKNTLTKNCKNIADFRYIFYFHKKCVFVEGLNYFHDFFYYHYDARCSIFCVNVIPDATKI